MSIADVCSRSPDPNTSDEAKGEVLSNVTSESRADSNMYALTENARQKLKEHGIEEY